MPNMSKNLLSASKMNAKPGIFSSKCTVSNRKTVIVCATIACACVYHHDIESLEPTNVSQLVSARLSEGVGQPLTVAHPTIYPEAKVAILCEARPSQETWPDRSLIIFTGRVWSYRSKVHTYCNWC